MRESRRGKRNELTIAVLEVENTVLLQDGAAHGLHHNARGGVVDLARLLVQLLGEEVDAQVTVLAGGRRGRDANDLARVALQHQNVADADVVAGDRDCVGRKVLRVSDSCSRSCTSFTAHLYVAGGDVLVMIVMVMAGRLLPDLDHLLVDRLAAHRVDDPVRQLVETMPERMTMACSAPQGIKIVTKGNRGEKQKLVYAPSSS